MKRNAIALPYTLLLVAVLAVFFSAMLLGAQQTLLFARLNDKDVRAREIARGACEMAYQLMKLDGYDWYQRGPIAPPLSNDKFGPDWSTERLGGTFLLKIYDETQLSPSPFPPQGTYRAIVATGTVGGQSAEARMTVKITNPFVNFLSVSTIFHCNRSVDGPLYVNAHPPDEPGDCRFVHQFQIPVDGVSNEFSGVSPKFGGEVRTMGKCYIENISYVGGANALPPLQLKGRYPAGTVLSHLDLQPLNNGTPQGGNLTFTRDSEIQTDLDYEVPVPSMQNVVDTYRDPGATVVTVPIDCSSSPNGVLAEFADGKLYLSNVAWKQVGRLYDRSLYLSARAARPAGSSEGMVPAGSDAARWSANQWTGRANEMAIHGQSDAIIRNEASWDDPVYPNAAYPPALTGNFEEIQTGTAFSLPAGTGDCCDIKRPVRSGAPFQVIPLDRAHWTVIRLVAQDKTLMSSDPTPVPHSPAVYVRGIVRGKAVLFYDVASDGMDPLPGGANDPLVNLLCVLGQHEAPDDVPSALKIQPNPHPLVPGGVHLEDDRMQLRPDAPGPFSEDYCMLICRDRIHFVSWASMFYTWLVDAAGNRVNYEQVLRDLDLDFESALGSKYRVLVAGGTYQQPFALQAVCLASRVGACQEADGRIALAPAQDPTDRVHLWRYNYVAPWGDCFPGGPWPTGVVAADLPTLPMFMRSASSSTVALPRVEGGCHSTSSYVGGLDMVFDYRWQQKDVHDVKDNIQLPVGPIVLQGPDE